ncbi:hypothetical protein GmHk_14G041354 [Glycine max]|nr:hypothetical protein GmHk_14G041354 [Glycine max]KAH1213375.1 hypothetical protein GmHk_14G041354 [Glycine max]
MNLFGGTERFEQLKLSLLVDGFSKVSVNKWMDITDMGYVIASRYNIIIVSLSRQQSMTFFPLRSQPPPDSSSHRIICVGHVFGNHFVQTIVPCHLQRCCGQAIVILRQSSGQFHILVECSNTQA